MKHRPSDLTDVQKIALVSVIDTGGLNDVISARYSLRTIRALHRKHLVKPVVLRFKEGERSWWALTADGRMLRDNVNAYMEKRGMLR